MSLTRWLLTPLSGLYAAVVCARNTYYDRVAAAVHRAPVPVISVGNITVGGTGKTPFVILVVQRLRVLGRRPAVLTRGYKATADTPADEVLEFQESLPDTPVVVDPDRVAGAAAACAVHDADFLVLDDGFQHRRLARDLDVVLIDALNPWGGNWVLPAGRLREPLRSLRRADVFVLTRANQVSPTVVAGIAAELRSQFGKPLFQADVEAAGLLMPDGCRVGSGELAGRCVLPVCGLGNPSTFVKLVKTLTPDAAAPVVLPDHARYESKQVFRVLDAARRADAEWVVTTRKDWVKLHHEWPDSAVPLVRLDMALTLGRGAAEFDVYLQRVLEKRT